MKIQKQATEEVEPQADEMEPYCEIVLMSYYETQLEPHSVTVLTPYYVIAQHLGRTSPAPRIKWKIIRNACH